MGNRHIDQRIPSDSNLFFRQALSPLKSLQKVANFRIMGGCVALGFAFILGSCGSQEPASTLSRAEKAIQKLPSQRFTPERINAVFHEDFVNGKPALYPPIVEPLGSQQETSPFNDYTAAVESWGYFFIDRTPGVLARTKFALTFEAISQWTRIRGEKGDPLFVEAYTIDERGRQIPDQIDGRIQNGRESRLARLRTKISIATLTIDSQIQFAHTGEYLEASIINIDDISAPLVGVVIREGNMQSKFELYPYQDGYLVYGRASAKLEKMQDRMTPDILADQITAIYSHLHQKLID